MSPSIDRGLLPTAALGPRPLNRLWQWLEQRLITKMALVQHPYYGYDYQPIAWGRWGEVLILHWPCGIGSQPHCHQHAFNLTQVLSGRLLERKYRLTGGQLQVVSERVLQAGQWSWTLPFQIHELVCLEPSRSLHLYFPGRSQ